MDERNSSDEPNGIPDASGQIANGLSDKEAGNRNQGNTDNEIDDSSRPRTSDGKKKLKEIVQVYMINKRIISAWRRRSPEDICPDCAKLKLHISKFIIKDHSSDRSQQAYKSVLPQIDAESHRDNPLSSGSGKCVLGTLAEIKEKSKKCPLCALVCLSVSDFEYQGVDAVALDAATCFASWQVDGREVIRDNLGSIISSRPRTRRIQLRWDNNNIDDSYLVLATPELSNKPVLEDTRYWESAGQFLGRNMSSAGNNSALVKGWLDLCQENHGALCETQRDPQFETMVAQPYFGVIDVHEMRLSPLPPGARYLALSYVWGDRERHLTTLDNVDLHKAYGGLEKVFAKLPRAIRDAISLVRSLGLRYIWIDSLCIVQDSKISWNLNAAAMDLVYGNAYLTICAADGDSVMAGLKGLSPGERRISQHTEECADKVVLMVSHLAETYIKRSRWNTRGWTFQERLLSRRCLIFTGDRVYFQCRSAVMSEDIAGEQQLGWSVELVQAPLQMLHEVSTRAFWVYKECIRLYTARTLGRPSDILAAFNGMANLIGSKMGSPLIFGLPSSHFDLALLWQPSHASEQRLAEETASSKNSFTSTEFPSWSWCGWKATVVYQDKALSGCLANVHQWLREHTWIQWHIRDYHGNLRPIWRKSNILKEDPNTETRWRGYGSTSPGTEVDDGFARIPRGGPKVLEFNRTLPDYPFRVSVAPNGENLSKEFPDQRFLQFWTWSCFLRLVTHTAAPVTNTDQSLMRCHIADYTGDWCGSIILDANWAKSQGRDSEQEFIALSDALDFSDEENDIWTYYIPKERRSSEWDLYYVILITTEKGIARRKGLGKVFKQSFQNSCFRELKWKEIILA